MTRWRKVSDKKIEQIHQELNDYYLQIIAFQDKDSQYYGDIATKFSKNLSELDDIMEEMRTYSNKNTQLINITK